jgi:exosortase A
MSPEALALALPGAALGRWRGLSDEWRTALIRLAVAAALMLALFARDWAAMADQWWNTATYNHILLVPLILAWMVWQRRGELVKLQPEAWWPGLVPFAGAALIWLLGAFSGLDFARQAGLVAMCAAVVPLMAGPRVLAGLFFPLFYMIFLIPAGQELVTVLQTLTAHITIALVHLSGIRAIIDGVFIATPAGLFEVAEACSGIKFLVAMIAFGALMANVCFISWPRRLILMAACIVVPILANGVRAWGTIYAAQLFGIKAAAGFDHIVYGWFFFAFVILIIVALAWRFFDRAVDDPLIDGEAIMADPLLARLAHLRLGTLTAIAAFLGVALGVHGWAWAANRMSAALPPRIDLPAVPGWTRVDYSPQIWWEPRATGAEHRLLGSYADAAGHRVDVFFALYSSQGEGREAGGFGEGALRPGSDWAWQADAPPIAGADGERLLGNGRLGRVAQTWYRTGGLLSGSNARLKLAVMADRLTLRADPAMLLIVSTEDVSGHRADPAIRAFVQSTGPLGPWMDRIGGVK